MSISKRDEHLKTLLPAEVFKELDEAEKTVLYEDFSNTDVRMLGAEGLEVIRRRVAVNLKSEFTRRLSQIQPEEYEVLKPWYLENCKTVEELYCTKCGALLGLEVDTIDDNMNESHHEGKFVIAIGDKLMSYRPRLDGVMGYLCGNVTKLPAETRDKVISEHKTKREKRRAELVKEVTERFSTEFEKNKDLSYKQMIGDKAFPKVKTKAQAAKVFNFTAPGEKEIEMAVELNLQNELPDPTLPRNVECGNDTRWAKIEMKNVPIAHVMTSITKEDIVKVKQEMDATNYTPDVKETKHGKTVETFELRKVK